MKRYRVVRILEYTYDSFEAYQEDWQRWTHVLPNQGTPLMQMRSVSLPVEEIEWESS